MSSVPDIASPATVPVNRKLKASPWRSVYELEICTVLPSIVPVRSRETKSPWCEPSRRVPDCFRCSVCVDALARYSICTSH